MSPTRVIVLGASFIAYCGGGPPVCADDPWLAAYFAVAFCRALGGHCR